MSKLLRKKEKTFLQIPSHIRGDWYTKVKNDIRQEALRGRIFSSMDVIDPKCRCTWADFFFLSKKPKIYYNAYIVIAQSEMVERVENKISEENIELFHKLGLDKLEWEVCDRDSLGRPLFYRMKNDRTEKVFEETGGMTFFDWERSLTDKYLKENQPDVYEEYNLDFTYEHGIGVNFIVDEDIITDEVITKHIQRFWELGEKPYKAETPVDKSKLIYDVNWYQLSNKSWSNMIAKPERLKLE